MTSPPTQSDSTPTPTVHWHRGKPGESRDENRKLLRRTGTLIKRDERETVLQLIRDWPPAEIMELLIHLPLKRARKLYHWLPPAPAVKVLVEVSPNLRAVLMEDSGINRVAQIAEDLSDDDAVELIANLPKEMVEPLMRRLPHGKALRERLEFAEDSAGAIMSNRFVAVVDDWKIGTALRQIRRSATDIDKLFEVYVVDATRRLVGRLKLRDLLLNAKGTLIRDVMREVPVTVQADADQERVLEMAERYSLQTIPVVNSAAQVIGRITLDELREVVRREADEDIKLMSGVAPDAQPDQSLAKVIRGRLPWLVGGLLGASMAAGVVGSFEEELERAAILASFIPVVMAMAGNAGIQASTVTVQGLAAGTLWIGDIGRRVTKEFAAALINGTAVAVLLGALILLAAQFLEITAPGRLALAAGLSVAAVTVMAATLGSTIPLLLNHFKVDPAVATGVFITTSNDIFGVLVYFLLATTLYLDGVPAM